MIAAPLEIFQSKSFETFHLVFRWMQTVVVRYKAVHVPGTGLMWPELSQFYQHCKLKQSRWRYSIQMVNWKQCSMWCTSQSPMTHFLIIKQMLCTTMACFSFSIRTQYNYCPNIDDWKQIIPNVKERKINKFQFRCRDSVFFLDQFSKFQIIDLLKWNGMKWNRMKRKRQRRKREKRSLNSPFFSSSSLFRFCFGSLGIRAFSCGVSQFSGNV